MNRTPGDGFTRRIVTPHTRRTSFAALGSAGLAAAFGGPMTADARKSGKKARRRCRRQAGECRGYFTNVCGSEDGCPDAFACCELLATCNSGAFVACLGDLET